MKAVFLLPSTGVAVGRNFTHIKLWTSINGKPRICGIKRKESSDRTGEVDKILGTITHGKVLSRIPVYLRALNPLIEEIKHKDVIFVYTLDTFILAWMAKVASRSNIKLVLFLMDIRNLFVGTRLRNHIVQSFLRFAFRQSDLILVSSRDYLEGYAVDYLKEIPDKWMEIENKVYVDEIPNFRRGQPEAFKGDDVVIGYFGIIRCPRSLDILLEVARRSSGVVKIIIFGEFLGVDDLVKQMEGVANISYRGKYRNPEDLSSIYASCDLVWACYPYDEKIGNQVWAKTNRFYEAGFFKKPVIVSKGTKDSEFVSANEYGMILDLGNRSESIEKLLSLQPQVVRKWEQELTKVPPENFCYSNEFEKVTRMLLK